METDEKNTPRLSTARSRELGEELRRVRHRAARSSGAVAEALGWSLGKLSKLETGSRGTSLWEIGTLLGHCGTDKTIRDRILALAGEADTGNLLRLHDPFHDSLTALTIHERAARTITTYEPLTIPALAQTRDYTHALTGDPDLAQARVTRQDALRRIDGPQMILYIHETALRLTVGDPAVMRDQLLHLTLMCGWPNVHPRVIPMTTHSHATLLYPATVLSFPAPVRTLAYTETDTATVFHDDPRIVSRYQTKMRRLQALALTLAQTRDLFARRADAYDQLTRR